jgi:hypothetical protein
MKFSNYIVLLTLLSLAACKKNIDLYPQSNLSTATYYTNYQELKAALAGVYNSMQKPIYYEWQLTELRSDNTKQGSPGSTSSTNRDLSDLDMFTPATSHQAIYQYWLNTYNVIRNANVVLEKLGVVYDPATGGINYEAITIPITDVDRKQMAGEAMFIRANSYFNLVRLFGGVFLVHKSITPSEAKLINRVSVPEIYKLIESDLRTAAAFMSPLKYGAVTPATDPNLGRATSWAAKGLLGKVLLTLNRKTEAIPFLQDVKDNSGYSMQSNYANVFSIGNEVNSEILFTVRFKAGGLGLGSLISNLFAPLGSGSTVIAGDGDGLNAPTNDLDTLTNGDGRKSTLIGVFGAGDKYVKKYIPPQPSVNDDTENDWPVLRYPDILLMLAEAQGYTQGSIDLLNVTRVRAGLTPYTMTTLPTTAAFELALSQERRVEFAFENQRWFDLLRYNTTLTTVKVEQAMKDHFAREYYNHYRLYVAPAPTLAELQGNVVPNRMLLPIPQREIDTNTGLVIAQNPGY